VNGLVNGAKSGGNSQKPIFRTNPHPERIAGDGVMVLHPSGAQVKTINKFAIHKPPESQEGHTVHGRSDRSRARLMRHLIQVNLKDASSERKGAKYTRLMFVTLTYPHIDGKPFTDWEKAKAHLKAFRKRLEAAYGLKWAVWVQEHQGSGALHFHLVILLSKVVCAAEFKPWLSRAWFEVVKSGNPDHLKAGTSAEPVYIEQGEPGNLLSYLSKELCAGGGKKYQVLHVNEETGEILETGKTWGIWGRDAFDGAKVIIAKICIRGRAAWQRFKENVSNRFKKSRYLRKVSTMAWWGGGLLYGDGMSLLDDLLEGIPAGAWSFA